MNQTLFQLISCDTSKVVYRQVILVQLHIYIGEESHHKNKDKINNKHSYLIQEAVDVHD